MQTPVVISKKINPIRKTPLRVFINLAIIIIAIPVTAIAAVSLSLYFCFLWLKEQLLGQQSKVADTAPQLYRFERDLIRTDQLLIKLVEDEGDDELMLLNEMWAREVYSEETVLYRLQTTPVIIGLHDAIGCFYLKENDAGVLLQILPPQPDPSVMPDTLLVWLSYNNLVPITIDTVGPFFLQNDEENAGLICGSNKRNKLELVLEWRS